MLYYQNLVNVCQTNSGIRQLFECSNFIRNSNMSPSFSDESLGVTRTRSTRNYCFSLFTVADLRYPLQKFHSTMFNLILISLFYPIFLHEQILQSCFNVMKDISPKQSENLKKQKNGLKTLFIVMINQSYIFCAKRYSQNIMLIYIANATVDEFSVIEKSRKRLKI